MDGVGGFPSLVNLASSFCLCAMVLLSSSSLLIQSGTDVESVDSASDVKNAAIVGDGVRRSCFETRSGGDSNVVA